MLDRLKAADLMLLWPDDVGLPADIGAIAILDRGPLVDTNGALRIEEIRARIGSRLHRVPRFRQLLHRPRRGLGWPLWVDAPSLDLARHVGVRAVPSPGGEPELLAMCEALRRTPFDSTRPLWEMWFLTGLSDERIAVFMRMHHTIADGVAGIETLAAFIDIEPNAGNESAPPWSPSAVPTALDLFVDNVKRRARECAHALSSLMHPRRVARAMRQGWPAFREVVAEGKAPRTSLNRPIGPDRRLAVVRTTLDLTKAIAHARTAKVNDVLLAAISQGLRELLVARGETTAGLVLRAFVPVSLHDPAADAQANLDGAMVVPLAIGEPDPLRRLDLIATESAERKKKSRPAAGSMFRFVWLQRAFLRFAKRQRMVNVYVANVPGPPIPLYLAGARILELFPVVPLSGNLSIGVGALSYAGQFNITVVADSSLCPDLDVFVSGTRIALESLAESIASRSADSSSQLVPTRIWDVA
jgi:WS/DGAT/MGAT family acyltransferase